MSILANTQIHLPNTQSHLSPAQSEQLFAKAIYQQASLKDMQFPQTSNHYCRQLKMSDIEELSTTVSGQSRRYLQLQPGKLDCSLSEVSLDGIILLREQLNAGSQIEAAPPGNFFPLATILGDSSGMRFCSKEFKQNSLLQASGSEWNMRFSEKLDYIGCILDKTMLAEHTQILTGRQVSPNWFISQSCQAQPNIMANYKHQLTTMISLLSEQAALLNNSDIRRQFSAQIFQLVIKLLNSTQHEQQKLMPQTKRLAGVRRVVDYLKVHASYLPTIPELCTVAQLSERSLEYGFKEQFGVTPIRYLKLVRLNGSKRDLVVAHPKMTKVVDIALRWGFVEFGRFAAEYGQLFKELPSETLRRV